MEKPMESLGEILRNTGMMSSPTLLGEKPCDDISREAEANRQTMTMTMIHRTTCLRCNGLAKNKAWPCTKDPEYDLKRRYIAAGVPYPALLTFDRFTHRKGTSTAFKEMKRMATDPRGWSILMGGYGSGKTHLALAAVYDLLRQDKFGWFITSGGLLDRWRSWFSDEEHDFSERFENDCSREHLVVVDDLGSERGTEWALERLTMFLDYRYGRDLPTIITTNNDQPTMARRSGGRIADRVFDRNTGKVKVVMMNCGSYRTGD